MLEEEPNASQNPAAFLQQSKLRTQFLIRFYKDNGEDSATRMAQLDTGSKVNIISREIIDVIGKPMKDYSGPPLKPLGPHIIPIGEIELDWHVAKYPKTYTHNFLVFDNLPLDVLLGEKTIADVGFYKEDRGVFFLS